MAKMNTKKALEIIRCAVNYEIAGYLQNPHDIGVDQRVKELDRAYKCISDEIHQLARTAIADAHDIMALKRQRCQLQDRKSVV